MKATTLILTTTLALSLSALAQAETPNVQPGLWEYNTRMTVEAAFPFPEQTDTTTDCVTEEDIAKADSFMNDLDMEDCTVTREELRRDGANWEMTCTEDDVTMDMTVVMNFHGDRSDGVITSAVETPMGPMKSTIHMDGRRIGECQ